MMRYAKDPNGPDRRKKKIVQHPMIELIGGSRDGQQFELSNPQTSCINFEDPDEDYIRTADRKGPIILFYYDFFLRRLLEQHNDQKS